MKTSRARTSQGPVRDQRAKLQEDQLSRASFAVREQLKALLSAADTPAAAKVNAARTLAEIEGLIGRHQSAPERGTTNPLSSLSRQALEDELNRLRTLFDLGLVS